MSDTVLQIMQPTNPVEPPYQYMMIDGCKVKVNYLPKPPAPSADKVLDRIHEILLASRLKKCYRTFASLLPRCNNDDVLVP